MAERHKVEKKIIHLTGLLKFCLTLRSPFFAFVSDTLSLTKKIKNACVKWPRVCFFKETPYANLNSHHQHTDKLTNP